MYCYLLTWVQLLEIVKSQKKDVSIISSEGYLLYSRDRRFEDRRARELYRESVRRAILNGKKLPEAVLEENADIVAQVRLSDPKVQVHSAAPPPKIGEEEPLLSF